MRGRCIINKLGNFEIPLANVHGIYYDESGQISSRPNRLVNPGATIDEAAVFSVLLFGGIVPPLSPWKEVHRLMPGYKYHGAEAICPVELNRERLLLNLDSEQQADLVVKTLDLILKKEIEGYGDPVLLFSGGVDSGLIASRLVASGYNNSLLINYSFGGEDPESELAESMARKLGLRYERVEADHQTLDCHLEPGRIYPQPFGDFSVIPTVDLAHAVVERLGEGRRVILDGTGGDSFGLSNKAKLWEQVYRVPKLIRRAVSDLYGNMLWYREGKLEYVTRILSRSSNMPIFAAAWAQNPLEGVFFNDQSGNSVYGMLQKWIDEWTENSTSQRIVATDIALIGANKAAQKAQPVFDSAGHKVVYPFLDNAIASIALDAVSFWQMDEPKAPLKRALARYVPTEMVYRPKSGFESDRKEIYFREEFIDYLRSAVEPTSPISHLLREKPVLKACQYLSHKEMLPVTTLNLLWTIVFTDRWYKTAF